MVMEVSSVLMNRVGTGMWSQQPWFYVFKFYLLQWFEINITGVQLLSKPCDKSEGSSDSSLIGTRQHILEEVQSNNLLSLCSEIQLLRHKVDQVNLELKSLKSKLKPQGSIYQRRKIYRITNYSLEDITIGNDSISTASTSYFSITDESDGPFPLNSQNLGLNLNINYIK